MVKKGYFTGAHIDTVSHEIVLTRRNENNVSHMVENSIKSSSVQVVECKSCGAKNQVMSDSNGECEFCGSPLKIKS
jgi:rRNA maturation endonuclease Nob1